MSESSESSPAVVSLQNTVHHLENNGNALFVSMKSRLDSYFDSTATRSKGWRLRQLNGLLRLLEQEQNKLASALYSDLHKSEEEAYITEIGVSIKEVRYTIKHIQRWMKPTKQSSPLFMWPSSSYIVPEPLGVCLIIGAWNYPLHLIFSPLIAAISAGNCVVLKPSELAPNTAQLLADLIPEYLDTNAIKVVQGAVQETTDLLALNFDKIFYTGGESVAKIVMRAASKHLTPVTLELGGKSPCLLDKDVELETAVKRIVWGKFMNAGQTCVAPDYLLVHQSQVDDVVDMFKKIIVKQYKKDPSKNRFYGRIVNKKHCQRLIDGLSEQNVVFGGQHDIEQCYIAPTIVLNPTSDSTFLQQEIFGPILPIISVPDFKSMLGYVANLPKPLAAYLFSNDKMSQQKYIDRVSAGSLCINDTTLFMANPKLPFGGVGTSGMGQYHGKYGFDAFSHKKSVLKRSFRFDHPFRYMPMNAIKMWVNKRFLR